MKPACLIAIATTLFCGTDAGLVCFADEAKSPQRMIALGDARVQVARGDSKPLMYDPTLSLASVNQILTESRRNTVPHVKVRVDRKQFSPKQLVDRPAVFEFEGDQYWGRVQAIFLEGPGDQSSKMIAKIVLDGQADDSYLAQGSLGQVFIAAGSAH